MNKSWSSEYFYGTRISEYGLANGYIDYRTLASAFDAVMNNEIVQATSAAGLGYWEPISGNEYDEENDSYTEIFQWFIVDEHGAEILQEFEEIVYYNETIDCFVWGITHYGTAWDYVLTNIKIDIEKA